MNQQRRRVVITGLGVVSAAGSHVRRFWDHLVAGRSAIHRIERFDASKYPVQIAAEVDDDSVPALAWSDEWRRRGRIARFAAAATAQAVEDAALDGRDGDRTGVALATGMGTYSHAEVFPACLAARATSSSFDWRTFTSSLMSTLEPRSLERRTPGSVPALLARQYGWSGPVLSVMTACAGGTQALGDGARWIRTGRADVVIAGGSDSEIYPMGLASFCLLGALSRDEDPSRGSRPFDRRRNGFVLGEGAAVLVLEERGRALARGARIHAELSGFGSACDAYRVTDPSPDGTGATLAMRRALDDAGLEDKAIGYINAHGTSTVANDRIETLAIKRVFGSRAPHIPISSTKSMIGHATVAAGAIEAVVSVLTLTHNFIHPTVNYEVPDPECDLDYVPNESRAITVDAVMSNSFAFGGQTASLIMCRHSA